MYILHLNDKQLAAMSRTLSKEINENEQGIYWTQLMEVNISILKVLREHAIIDRDIRYEILIDKELKSREEQLKNAKEK